MINVFIDGQAGTTGLQLKNKLLNHPYVKLLEIDGDKRKDTDERKRLMNILTSSKTLTKKSVNLLSKAN